MDVRSWNKTESDDDECNIGYNININILINNAAITMKLLHIYDAVKLQKDNTKKNNYDVLIQWIYYAILKMQL